MRALACPISHYPDHVCLVWLGQGRPCVPTLRGDKVRKPGKPTGAYHNLIIQIRISLSGLFILPFVFLAKQLNLAIRNKVLQ